MRKPMSLLYLLLWALWPPAAVAQDAPVKPRGLQIAPNALQEPAQPMRVAAGPLQPLWVLILRDCDRDGSQPELVARPGCITPLRTQRIETDERGQYEGDQGLGEPPGQPPLPRGEALWLRVAAVAGGDRLFEDVIFAIRDPAQARCDAWRSGLGAFGLGRCRLGLERVFNPVRGSTEERPNVWLRVSRVDPRREPVTPQAVPGTDGATGASWDGLDALLLTLGPAAGEAAGLYRLELKRGTRTRLLPAPAERTLAAPLRVGSGQVAVIEEQPVPSATLLLLQGARVTRRLPLARTVHQLLAVDQEGRRVLAVSRSRGEPELLAIDLASGAEVGVGDRTLVAAALASRRDGLIAHAFPDAAGQDGWELVLRDPQGASVRALAQGRGHALLPAWHPDGGELVYLEEPAVAGGAP